MTADPLHRAAMRAQELADGASGEPWEALLSEGDGDAAVRGRVGNHTWSVADVGFDPDAELIAACDPPFLRAVGELLAGLAATEPWDFRHDEALAVARALLGESE